MQNFGGVQVENNPANQIRVGVTNYSHELFVTSALGVYVAAEN